MRNYRFRPPGEPVTGPPRNPRRSRWVRALSVITPVVVAGSGLLNLSSLINTPPLGDRPNLLRGIFPLDFSGFNRSATLLLGFALILTAMHLAAGKRRAFVLAIALSLASSMIHLTRAWDVEEACCSIGVAALLLVVRSEFRVGSGRPNLPLAAKRAASAITVAAAYGAAGFWLLEPHEFGRNFHWWEAIARTLRVMVLVGDPGLSPHTAYAAWFLESLYLASAATFLYCGVTLFRPVTYRFRQSDGDRELAGMIAARYATSGQDFFKQWPDKSLFFSASRRSFLAYRVASHFALVLGDPVGPDDEIQSTIQQFADFCQRRGWRVGFHQVRADRLEYYESLGFRFLKVGHDALVDITSFSLQGSAMKEFRNTVNRLDRLGYRVEGFDPPINEHLLVHLRRISDEWLTIPGHRERRFTLGRFDTDYVRSARVFVAFDPAGEAVAFLNLVPSYRADLATVDLMRRRRESVNGIMDYLFAKTFFSLQKEGIDRFSLGMAPGGGQNDGEPGPAEERAVSWAMRRFPSLFRAESLRRFKAKYAHQWEPLYATYRSRLDLPRLALALRSVTEDGGKFGSRA